MTGATSAPRGIWRAVPPPLRPLLSRAPTAFAGVGGAAVAVSVISLIRTKVLTTKLPQAQYGVLSYAFSLFVVVQAVASMGLGTGLRRRLGLGGERREDLVGTALALTLGVGAVGAVAGVAVGVVFGSSILRDARGPVVLAIVFASLPLAVLDALWLDSLYASSRRRAVAAYMLVFRTFAVLSIAAGALFGGLEGAAAGFLVGFVPSAVWGFRGAGMGIRPRLHRPSARGLIRDGGINQTIIASNQLTTFIVRSLVIAELGKVPLAIYAVASSITVPLSQFIGAGLAGTFFNEFARGTASDRVAALRTHRRIVEAVAIVMLPLGVILLPITVRVLTTAAYSASARPGRVLLLAATIEGLFFIDGNALFIADRIGWYLFLQNFANVILVGFAALAMHWSLTWVAFASVLSQVFQLGASRIPVNRMCPGVPPPPPLVIVGLTLSVIAAVVGGALTYAFGFAALAVAALHLGRVRRERRVRPGLR